MFILLDYSTRGLVDLVLFWFCFKALIGLTLGFNISKLGFALVLSPKSIDLALV